MLAIAAPLSGCVGSRLPMIALIFTRRSFSGHERPRIFIRSPNDGQAIGSTEMQKVFIAEEPLQRLNDHVGLRRRVDRLPLDHVDRDASEFGVVEVPADPKQLPACTTR